MEVNVPSRTMVDYSDEHIGKCMETFRNIFTKKNLLFLHQSIFCYRIGEKIVSLFVCHRGNSYGFGTT